ncbi:MAG TPA: hypothetical protein VG078_00505 [Acidimicrobiales bacterium]|nr:hypothetical protein [Acidimicrobiales bacterium]
MGERIVDLDGTLTAAPSRFSLQVGPAEHVEAPAGTPLEAGCDRFRWRATNHSCRPNSLVVGRSIVSCRPVGADDEVTIHYEATEWELTSTFRCTCGWCRGREIRGFRHLTVAQRSALEELIADHLRPFVGPSAS